MPRGKSGRGKARGHGFSHSGRGRGRGRGGAGRGRNRELIPTTMGYMYKLTQEDADEPDLEEDFVLYGQFDDASDSETGASNKPRAKQSNRTTEQQTNGDDYEDEDAFARPGLGSNRSKNITRGTESRSIGVFTKSTFGIGNSIYLKPVTFARSSTVMNREPDLEPEARTPTPPIEKQAREMIVEIDDADDDVNIMSKDDEEVVINGTTKFGRYQCDKDKGKSPDAKVCNEIYDDQEKTFNIKEVVNDIDKHQEESNRQGEEPNQNVNGEDNDEDDTEQEEAEDEDKYSDVDEDLEVMRDFMENVTLTEKEIDSILSREHEPLDYEQDLLNEEEGEEYHDDEVALYDYLLGLEDPFEPEEIMRLSLKDSMKDVPPSLRPGIRAWITSHEKAEKKKRKAEKKLKRQEKKEKNKAAEKDDGAHIQLYKLDRRIRDFIEDDQLNSYQLAPMSKHSRRQVHLLATAYNLKSKSIGSGAKRCPILTKTDHTLIPQDRRHIDRFLANAQTSLESQSIILRKYRVDSGHGKSRSKKGSESPRIRSDRNINDDGPVHGTVVAFNAAPISETNVGHRMLAAMGWKQGDALGSSSDGITAPIEAVIRKNRRGLGS